MDRFRVLMLAFHWGFRCHLTVFMRKKNGHTAKHGRCFVSSVPLSPAAYPISFSGSARLGFSIGALPSTGEMVMTDVPLATKRPNFLSLPLRFDESFGSAKHVSKK